MCVALGGMADHGMKLQNSIGRGTEAREAEAASRRRRILVVDDSAPQRMVLARLLQKWGYAVVEAGSGAEALDVILGSEVDIILSDWMMPGMSGVEFCRTFRALERRRYGYFVLLTSKSGKEDVALGLDSGADDFLTKPVNSGELRARLLAGERIVGMQEELRDKNDLLSGALDQLKRVHDGLNRDLLEARRFQQSLVPDRVREFEGGRVSLMFRPSGHVGGDFIGFFRVSETRIGLYSIDVSGHGIASALLAARIAGYLSGQSPEQNIALTIDELGLYTMRPPEEVCERLNDLMLSQMETDLYLTMLLADCNLRTGEVRMVQAGHPNPALQRASGHVERPGAGGLPVGLLPRAAWTPFTVRLGPGDRLFALSDGVTECPGPDGRDFGEEAFERFVRRNAATRGPALLEALDWELDRYSGLQDLPDDVSCAMLEFSGTASAEEA
jgi:sigma-B regulation protein RsbU (phosphoserine phosphatase)